jgi:excisionase family DNA binding protein
MQQPSSPSLAAADSVIAESHELDEVNMPGAALRNSEPEYKTAGQRKPPLAETSRWPQEPGELSSVANLSPSTAAEAARPSPNTVAFPASQLKQERLLDAREVAARLAEIPIPGGFERLLTLREAAPVLGLHWKTLEGMARNRKIPALKLGKRWKFRLSSLNAWLENKLNSTTTDYAVLTEEE